MSIASRINEMTEHLRNDWNSIDKLGLDITEENSNDNLDKNIKNIAPVLDRFYNQASDKTDLAKNGVVGRTSQESTTGKNLINDYDLINRWHIASVSDNLLTTIAISSDWDTFQPITRNQTISLVQGTEYYVSFDMRLKSGTYSGIVGRALIIDTNANGLATNGSAVSQPTMTSSFQRMVFKQTANTTTDIRIGLMIQIQRGVNNAVFEIKNIMISTSSDTTYEEYTGNQPSPSPDYPQKITNLSGDVEYKVRGKNLYTDEIEYNNSVLTSNGAINSATGFIISKSFSIDISKDIYVSFVVGSLTDKTMGVGYYDINNNFISRPNFETTPTKLTPPSNAQYLKLSYDARNFSNIQVEYNQATTYEPYISESFSLSLKSKNLFDKNNANIIKCGISYHKINASDSNRLLYISIQPNTTYTIQRRNDGNVNRFRAGTCSIVPANGVDLDNAIETDNAESITITSRENDTYLAVMYYRTQETILTEQQILDSIQIEEGSTATTYEPYYDIELCNISDYKDRIYSQNGEFYLEKKTGKVVLDGSENYVLYSVTGGNLFRNNNVDVSIGGISPMSNYFIGINSANSRYDGTIYYNYNAVPSHTAFDILTSKFNNVEDFKTWLSTHNTEVQYVLATPTTTEITQENYPTLYSQLLAIQEFLTKYKINKEFLLDYSSLEIEY